VLLGAVEDIQACPLPVVVVVQLGALEIQASSWPVVQPGAVDDGQASPLPVVCSGASTCPAAVVPSGAVAVDGIASLVVLSGAAAPFDHTYHAHILVRAQPACSP
jgi:hypothetical protein